MKSAVLARASGAARVVGFSIWHLREKTARPFYSDAHDAEGGTSSRRTSACCAAARRAGRRDPVSARRRAVRRRSTSCARGSGGPPVRADQSRRGVAEQALAAGAVRRAGRVPAGRVRPDAGRAVGTGRGGARATRSSPPRRNAAVLAPPTRVADLVALSRAAALVDVGRHRPAAHRDRRRHADRQRCSDRPTRPQRPVCGRTMWRCRATRPAGATTIAAATKRRGACEGRGRCAEVVRRRVAATESPGRRRERSQAERSGMVTARRRWRGAARLRARRGRAVARAPTPRSLAIGAAGRRDRARRCASGRPGISRRGARSRRTGPYALTRHPLYAGSIDHGRRASAIAAQQRSSWPRWSARTWR